MSLDRLSHIQFDDSIVPIRDHSGMDSIKLWRKLNPPQNGNDWQKIVSTDPVKEAGDVNYVPVRVSEFRTRDNSTMTKLKRLFSRSRTDETILTLPDGTEVEAAMEKSRQAILAWGKEAGVALDEKTISKLVPDVETVDQLGKNLSIINMKSKEIVLPHKETPTSRDNKEKELPLKKRIEKIEEGLENFEKLLLSKLAASKIQRPGLDEAFRKPFDLVRANKTNALKSYADAVKIAKSNDLSMIALLISQKNQKYFSYAFKEDYDYNGEGYMAFSPLTRTFIMSEFRSPDNPLDAVVFMHEAVHCMHATKQRERNKDAHIKFRMSLSDGKKGVVIKEEWDAYALELEALNVLLDNAMYVAAQRNEKLDANVVMEILHLRPDQRSPVALLCSFGLSYFKNSTIDNLSVEYVNHVAQNMVGHGVDLYSPDFQLLMRSADYRHLFEP